MDSTKIVQDLQSAIQDLQKTDDELKAAQRNIQQLSADRQSKMEKVNDLRAALDRSLNEQLQAAGVEPPRPGVIVR